MAVSGRKISDFKASVSRGSAEDFEHSCDSCLADDQHVEAHGFCVNCQEYLCKHCLRCHQRNKASKHNQLLAKDEMHKHTVATRPVEVCTEKCSIHTNEIIKFFCPRHEYIGCTDCMTMKHRTCDLDYIPDKCAGIGNSKEYTVIMRTVGKKMKEASTVMEKARTKDKEIDQNFGKLTELSTAAAQPRSNAAAPLRSIVAVAAPPRATAASDLPRANVVDTRKTRTFSSISHKADINVRTKSNKIKYSITGIAVLSPSKVVLAFYNSNTLKLVDIQRKAVVKEKKLGATPRDIAVLPQDQIAVTLPFKRQIIVMTTAGQLSTDRSIEVKGYCHGITYHQDCLYVLCHDPRSVNVLDMKGNIKNTISLVDEAVFSYPDYIALSQDHKLLYVSNYVNSSIVSVTLQGEVSAVYKHQDLGGPEGMLVLDDGSLLVCCCINHTIHHVSADLTQGQKVMDGLCLPQSICYSADRSQVYVGGYIDQLQVFDIQYNI